MRQGVVAAVTACLIWGLFPLYWPLLHPADPMEVLAHRVVWSLVILALLVTGLRQWRPILRMGARTWLLAGCAAVLIALNWWLYIFAVMGGHIVDAALGYYINPLVSVLLGILVFRENLSGLQWGAVGLGAAAVVVLALGSSGLPWIAMALAVTFACYGLVKKVVPLQPAESLTAEGVVLIVPTLIYLVLLQRAGQATFVGHGAGHALLMVGGGLLTVVPLLAFAAAARTLPLSVLGLLQYLTPTVQFLIGVLWAGESMPPSRWAGFVLVWAALAVLTVDVARKARRRMRGAPVAVTADDRALPEPG